VRAHERLLGAVARLERELVEARAAGEWASVLSKPYTFFSFFITLEPRVE